MAAKQISWGEKSRASAFTPGSGSLQLELRWMGKQIVETIRGNLRILRAGSGTGELNQFVARVC
jgi:hypothetical protein